MAIRERNEPRASFRHQQRLVSFRQRRLVRFITDQAKALHDVHRVQEPLQAALTGQRQLGIDSQFDIRHPQRVGVELERKANLTFGVDQTVPQPRQR